MAFQAMTILLQGFQDGTVLQDDIGETWLLLLFIFILLLVICTCLLIVALLDFFFTA